MTITLKEWRIQHKFLITGFVQEDLSGRLYVGHFVELRKIVSIDDESSCFRVVCEGLAYRLPKEEEKKRG